jgi:hypothetical protein
MRRVGCGRFKEQEFRHMSHYLAKRQRKGSVPIRTHDAPVLFKQQYVQHQRFSNITEQFLLFRRQS